MAVVTVNPHKQSKQPRRLLSGDKRTLNRKLLEQCQLPDPVIGGKGSKIHRPKEWRAWRAGTRRSGFLLGLAPRRRTRWFSLSLNRLTHFSSQLLRNRTQPRVRRLARGDRHLQKTKRWRGGTRSGSR